MKVAKHLLSRLKRNQLAFYAITLIFLNGKIWGQKATTYAPNWESLHQHECPEWFRDAKFGIFMHWGVMSVVKDNDGWYGRHMYMKTGGKWGNDYFDHLENYGHPSEFGYKDLIPKWKAENWDPEALVEFYKEIGAKYVVPVAVHHDNFDLYDSSFQPWNSVNMGPKRDVIGEWKKAAEKHGLRFGVSSHSDRAWSWLNPSHGHDIEGEYKDIPYDGNLTLEDGKGTWWEGYDPADLYTRPHKMSEAPDKEYCDTWYKRTIELTDKYQPDLIYFDGPLPLVCNGKACSEARTWTQKYGLNFAAHYYNDNTKRNKGTNEAIIAIKEWGPGTVPDTKPVVLDIEKGGADKILEYPWQTDTSLSGTWFWNGSGYSEISDTIVIHNMCDVVSKNGNYLLNVGLTADGVLPAHEKKTLENIGAWFKINGEAIYGTRPWVQFGEGRTKVETGHFKQNKEPYTSKDIRFTTKGDILYAIFMGWPDSGKVIIKSVAKGSGLYNQKVKSVSLLGYDGKLLWKQTQKGLVVKLPKRSPGNYAYTLKIN
ncbi:alpha-L-fucosidase [Snuella lapsa]|uniref:alpha-L-fucosidase n=1 Tax=Snuella lapsa TaxID=870481 RepID=A0ABP6YIZ1_9FLAO